MGSPKPAKKQKNPPKRKSKPWRDDPEILARLVLVERLWVAGLSNREAARQLGVDEGTIRSDVARLNELYLERIGEEQTEGLRAQRIAELREIKRLSLAAARWDEMCERAVLFDEPLLGPDGQPMLDKEGRPRTVYRPEKGSVSFRGSKPAAIGEAQKAVMNMAKLQGLVVDKVAPTDGDGNPLAELFRWAVGKEAAGA